jgi:DNA-binding NtrC family response regulator
MAGIDGMKVLKTFHEDYPDTITIMITGFSTVETAVEAMKLGAFDYIPSPSLPWNFFAWRERKCLIRIFVKGDICDLTHSFLVL